MRISRSTRIGRARLLEPEPETVYATGVADQVPHTAKGTELNYTDNGGWRNERPLEIDGSVLVPSVQK